ncbi:MAG: transposase [Candidatus Neomarinimicrobiota bacterium]
MYFITICSYHKQPIFGSVHKNRMNLNDFGTIINYEWARTADLRYNIDIDNYVIMPNHLHGIITVVSDNCMGTVRRAHTSEVFGKPVPDSIPTIIRSFKSAVTRSTHESGYLINSRIWHRNYYEHVIRSEAALEHIREYINTNPGNWSRDSENPDQSGLDEFEKWLNHYKIPDPTAKQNRILD